VKRKGCFWVYPECAFVPQRMELNRKFSQIFANSPDEEDEQGLNREWTANGREYTFAVTL
jgi:hypothetical protein